MKTAADRRSTDPEQIRREAQAWLRRLASGEATQLDLQGFRRWRETSPAHRAAFADAQRLWKMLDPAIEQALRSAALAPARLHAPARPRYSRRAFLGTAVAAAAAAGLAAVYPPLGLWPAAGEWQADYRTGTGEQRRLALADRVGVEMNTQTSISRQAADGAAPAGIRLIAGEAAIDLSGASRAFSVSAGAGRSIAEAARFEVRHLDGQVCVRCEQGLVRVEHPMGARTLGARQQLLYDASMLGAAAPLAAADRSAWREGILVFRQTPLARVVDEINRYRPGRVVLLAGHLRDRAVSGRFAIASLDTVLLQIQQSYALNARALPGGILVLS